jgi:hypothetical protein
MAATTEQEKLLAVQGQARRYLEARYGESVWFRAPETFGNWFERWVWAVSGDHVDLAEECMTAIEKNMREAKEEGLLT